MKTGLITHTDCNSHAKQGHPERPERLSSILSHFEGTGLKQDLVTISALPANDQLIQRVHPLDLITKVKASLPEKGMTNIDADTYLCPLSLQAARLAAGACIQATQMVLHGELDNAFCAVRPPGHHAELAQAMGFCLFNNVALGVETALLHPDINRVAILDFDVHHCNGTVDIFKDRDEVLVCSSFQAAHYPFRYLDFTNKHILNSPLAAGDGSDAFRLTVEQQWMPALETHSPDMIFISAGFDAHKDDPLGSLQFETEDYGWVTRQVRLLAESLCKGRLVSTLEGGYDLNALAVSAASHVQALLGHEG